MRARDIRRTSIVKWGDEIYRAVGKPIAGCITAVNMRTNEQVTIGTKGAEHVHYAPVGCVVLCSYWRFEYKIVSHNSDGSVTVEKIDSAYNRASQWASEIGKVWSHRTPLDYKDKIIRLPGKE